MYVITAEVKYDDDDDYIKSFLGSNDWGFCWNESEVLNVIFFEKISEAKKYINTLTKEDFVHYDYYYVDVKNIKIQEVKLFDIS